MKRKILVVDDEPEIVESVESVLLDHGFDVFKAGNGAEALEIAKREWPDLIISDICMPGLTGYEFWNELKKINDGKGGKIPMIIISAHGDMSSFFDAWDICSFLSKPFNMQELMAKVSETIGPEADEKAALIKAFEKRKKIMVRAVKDFAFQRLTDFLESQGHTVLHEIDEDEAIVQIPRFLPDFFFCQYREDTVASDIKKILEGLSGMRPPKKVGFAAVCQKRQAEEARKNVPDPFPVFVYSGSEGLIQSVKNFMEEKLKDGNPQGS